jgi:hypothetical protein
MAVFTVIDHTEIGTGGAASWSAASIASSYDHLLLKASIRSERAGAVSEQMAVTLNGSTSTSDYSSLYLYASTTTPDAGHATTGDFGSWKYGQAPGPNALADTFAAWTLWIPNYADTVGFKSGILNVAFENNLTASDKWQVMALAGLFHSTAAIDEIEIVCYNGADIAEFSTFTLYGVKGA